MNSLQRLCLSLLLTGFAVAACADKPAYDVSAIRLPPNFHLSVFTDKVPDARSLAVGEDGTVYVGTLKGTVYAVRDLNQDGKADWVMPVATGLNSPNGVAVWQQDLYIAEIDRISKVSQVASKLGRPVTPETVFDGYPKDRHHGWKYLRVGPDGKLYAGVGAPCNICLSKDKVYASLTRLDPDGQHFEIFAEGIRNTVGFDWNPANGQLFFTDNGRDMLGDDIPPEELNAAPKPGLHFGYPYCHAGEIADPEFGQMKSCAEFTPPVWKFPAHVAPLGVHFYRGKQFPASYQGQLLVVQHGSWNRSKPQGYRVVMVKFKDGAPVGEETFAEGWLQSNGGVLGRPVDVQEMADGSVLISDDQNGAVYRVVYQP